MSLITFAESRPWARSIKNRVSQRQMPPWHIDPSVGVQKFKNDMSLSQKQIDTIVAWVDAGAPQGDPKDMPPAKPISADNEWTGVKDGFGKPDLVIRSSEYKMPAKGQVVWYRPMSDIPITEPRWVKMVEIRPTNLNARKVVHHSIAYHVLSPDNTAEVNTGTLESARLSAVARRSTPVSAVGRGTVVEAAVREPLPPAPSGDSSNTIPPAGAETKLPASGTVVLDVEQGGIEVPSFVGKTFRRAIETAQDVGLQLDAVGSGLARQQSPAAGTHVPAGSRVTVQFGR
jgi:hypothetical protein